MLTLFNGLENCMKLDKPFEIIIQDLVDGSFVQNPYHPEPDPRCVILFIYLFFFFYINFFGNKLKFQTKVYFDRDDDHNDHLGIDTMVTQGYEK